MLILFVLFLLIFFVSAISTHIYCNVYRSRFISYDTRGNRTHAGETQKNRLSLYEGALNPINVGLPVNVSIYPLLAMQSSAGDNAVGVFAAGWA